MIYSLGERRVETEGDDYFVADNARVIGSVQLGRNASVWFGATIRGDNELITVGENSNIQDGAVLHTDDGIPLTVGRGVTVGHLVMLHGCTIADNCLIGIGSVILNRTRIGKNTIIGANTLIGENKEIPEGVLVLGSPGKVVRQLSPEEIAMLEKSALHYVENGKRYKRDLKPDGRA
jgi:carbonic anhydrase/acetyltransferase-like protein (isoleucine patch superfamily)